MLDSLKRLRLKLKSSTSGLNWPDMAVSTHIGRARALNEDSFLLARLPGMRPSLVAVADGIGGEEAGEVASYFALRYVLQEWLLGVQDGHNGLRGTRQTLLRGLEHANGFLTSLNRRLGGRHFTMGTTVVAAAFTGSHAIVAHAGDSRCYCLRNNSLQQLTRDDTRVQQLVDDGEIHRYEVMGHPDEHMLSNCLGMHSDVRLSCRTITCHPRDRFLLCSDGVTQSIPEVRLYQCVRESRNARQAVDRLVRESLQKGAHDNITAAVVIL